MKARFAKTTTNDSGSIKRLTISAIAVLCLGMAGTSLAQSTTLSDLVSVIDPATGQNLDFPLPENAAEPFLAAFYGPINAPNQWILFNEPTTTGENSDRLSIRAGFLYFESDPLGPLFTDLPANPNMVLIETGKPQPVSQYFTPFPGTVLPQIFVTSDLNIPEPVSAALLGVGGLLIMRRRRRG
jgi:hypothetical protein